MGSRTLDQLGVGRPQIVPRQAWARLPRDQRPAQVAGAGEPGPEPEGAGGGGESLDEACGVVLIGQVRQQMRFARLPARQSGLAYLDVGCARLSELHPG